MSSKRVSVRLPVLAELPASHTETSFTSAIYLCKNVAKLTFSGAQGRDSAQLLLIKRDYGQPSGCPLEILSVDRLPKSCASL
jgi:hypothetical protein